MVDRSYTFAIMATVLFLAAIVVFMIGFFDIGVKKKDEEKPQDPEEEQPEQENAVPAPEGEEAEGYTDIYGEKITASNVDERIEEDTNRWIIILSGILALLALICLITQIRS